MENKIGTLTVTVDLPAAATTNETEPNKTGYANSYRNGPSFSPHDARSVGDRKGSRKALLRGTRHGLDEGFEPEGRTPSHRS
jgi:hypothetical protein